MPSKRKSVVIESLDRRINTAAVAPVSETTSAVWNDPHPTAVVDVFHSSTTPRLDRVSVAVDKKQILRVTGTFGDDSVRIRRVKGRMEIRTYTRETHGRPAPSSTAVELLTTTIESVFRVNAKPLKGVVFNGAAGSDTAKFGAMPYYPVAYNTEAVSYKTAPPEAAAGQTPSDTVAGGKWRPGLGWATQAAQQQALADKSHAAVAFFGDSHAAKFFDYGGVALRQHFAKALNLGIGGDTTRQLLTRIKAGLFDRYAPKILVVSVGTNNLNSLTTGGTDEQIYQGVLAVVAALREKLPNVRLVLIGLLPRTGLGVDDRTITLNTRLATEAEENGFAFLDVYPRFVNSKPGAYAILGTDSHYTARGYRAMAYMLDQLIRAKWPELYPTPPVQTA